MFCPYVRKSYMRLTGIGYNEEMAENGSLVYEHFENEECKKEQCGVWFEGRCRYNEQ